MTAAANKPLEPADLNLIRLVHAANSAHPGPFLVSPSKMKRASKLAERGLLRDSKIRLFPNPENWKAYYSTEAGIDVYNISTKAAA